MIEFQIPLYICFRFHDNLEAYIEDDEQHVSKEAFLELVEGIFETWP